MFILSAHNKRWRISKGGHIVLSGIGSVTQAANLARLHGIVLSEFKPFNHLRRVA